MKNPGTFGQVIMEQFYVDTEFSVLLVAIFFITKARDTLETLGAQNTPRNFKMTL